MSSFSVKTLTDTRLDTARLSCWTQWWNGMEDGTQPWCAWHHQLMTAKRCQPMTAKYVWWTSHHPRLMLTGAPSNGSDRCGMEVMTVMMSWSPQRAARETYPLLSALPPLGPRWSCPVDPLHHWTAAALLQPLPGPSPPPLALVLVCQHTQSS